MAPPDAHGSHTAPRADAGELRSRAPMTTGPLASLRIVAVRPDREEERATAERVLAGPLVGRDDLAARRGRRPGRTGELWQGDGWFLKRRALRTYEQLEQATSA